MINFEIDPSVLYPLLPKGVELDRWGNQTLVSLVGFQFNNTRVRGFAVPFHQHFDEINLRFYVKRRLGDEWRRGVVFVQEIVPRPALTWVARLLYRENYVTRRMKSHVDDPDAKPRFVKYTWRRKGNWNSLSAYTQGMPESMKDGSLEQFIAEHYWGYVGTPSRCTEYAVEHVPWKIWKATDVRVACHVEQNYGAPFSPALSANPHSAFVAEGSPIAVYPGFEIPPLN